jgi:excisionase family DNA binding protein
VYVVFQLTQENATMLHRKVNDGPPDPPPAPSFVSVKKAAEMMGVSNKLIYEMFSRSELKGYKARTKVLIDSASVTSYIQEHSNEKPQEHDVPGVLPKSRKPSLKPMGFRFLPPNA